MMSSSPYMPRHRAVYCVFGRLWKQRSIVSVISRAVSRERGIHTHPNPKWRRNSRTCVGLSSGHTYQRIDGTAETGVVGSGFSSGTAGCMLARTTASARMKFSNSLAVIETVADGIFSAVVLRSSASVYSKVNTGFSIGLVAHPMVVGTTGAGNRILASAAP